MKNGARNQTNWEIKKIRLLLQSIPSNSVPNLQVNQQQILKKIIDIPVYPYISNCYDIVTTTMTTSTSISKPIIPTNTPFDCAVMPACIYCFKFPHLRFLTEINDNNSINSTLDNPFTNQKYLDLLGNRNYNPWIDSSESPLDNPNTNPLSFIDLHQQQQQQHRRLFPKVLPNTESTTEDVDPLSGSCMNGWTTSSCNNPYFDTISLSNSATSTLTIDRIISISIISSLVSVFILFL